MGGAHPIQTNADVIKTGCSNIFNVVFVDQGSVGGQADVKTHGLGASGNLKNIAAQ